ncbi:MAG TPA: pyruvate dehydrogenase (acetyl-transferring) E1 component subunit alpha [Myxococcota bacterium]|nr:pyruvate dehydrogenase (acetyl-transferring) E1 component subunit alpha [Myxococcota bacterium]HRY96194.1 pyruvate dehydrogenase (acetyl-transferring) E1 component subunit alpha [Myxococcota bacterium]
MPLSDLASFQVQRLQVLDQDGKLDQSLEPDLTRAQKLALYRAMLLAREGDQKAIKLQRQGRIGTFGPSTGQEAASTAPAFAMTERDWFVGAFRELGGWLARGMPLENFLWFHNGWEEGSVFPSLGRTLPVNIIVGSQTLHAVGLAYAMKLRGEQDSAVVAFFGDGATSQGDFHEALNFASVWQAPVVFICQNNQWAISLPVGKQTHSRTLAQKAIAYDMPGIQVDGNDALAMFRATQEALARAKAGGGPTLIEAVTYRLMMHTTSDDPTKYRTEAEVQEWWQRDPLKRFRLYLGAQGLLDEAGHAALEAEVKAEVEAAVARFEARRDFKPDAPFDHVFGTPHPELEGQRKTFLRELAQAGGPEARHG